MKMSCQPSKIRMPGMRERVINICIMILHYYVFLSSITMEVSESNFEADDHMSHENYEPSLNLSLR